MNGHPKASGLLALAALATALAGCPLQGVVCREGLNRCGDGCADLTNDERNCGGCGLACGPAQTCQASACVCQAGFTSCGGACVDTRADPRHCGACDKPCGAQQVCEASACKVSCSLGTSTLCGQSCVDLGTDVSNCGACGRACSGAQSCRRGLCTFDVIAACMSSGQVVGVQGATQFVGPKQAMGSAPAAMAVFRDELLALDAVDNRLREALLDGLSVLPSSVPVGAVANHLLVEDPYVFVVNAGTATLQVLQREGASTAGADAGVAFDGGLRLATVAELPLGANTFPQAIAKVGSMGFIPLYGGYGATAAKAGQKVVRVDLTNPKAPQKAGEYDLSTLDLSPFDGGSPVPRPFGIVAHQGKLYLPLNNLNPDTYVPEGPGLLARLDPVSGDLRRVELGPDCLNASWAVSDGQRLYVSCAGKTDYNPDFSPKATQKTGVVVLGEGDVPVATWSVACPASADAGCVPPSVARFAVSGGRLYVGDQSAGRLFVVDVAGGAVVERRGYRADAGPLTVCPVPSGTGFSNVSDVVAVP